MKVYNLSDFEKNEAWILFRLDVMVAHEFHDVYILMHAPSGFVLAHEIIEHEFSQKNADTIFKQASIQGRTPNRILLPKGDPAAPFIEQSAQKLGIIFEQVPARALEDLTAPLKASFGSQFFSTASIGYNAPSSVDDTDIESIKAMIPDAYSPCHCNSGKKYKFCCKKIFIEMMEAMCEAEDGNLSESLKWIEKARVLVGDTAEVLCREAIVYSFFDKRKSRALLQKCLALHPNHPRANYIAGIDLVEDGNFNGAIKAYQTAIAYYPETDHFRLNEAYNNLGTAFYELGEIEQAKSAWETALLHVPSDKCTQENLQEFIYGK